MHSTVLASAIPIIQWVTVILLALASICMIGEIGHWRLPPVLKLFLALILAGATGGVCWLLISLQPLLVAKLALIAMLVSGTIACWFCLTQLGRWHTALTGIQQECELATNLTFLQGEMTRAQLEALNERLRQAAQPEEREIAETMLKSLSPFVMLYLKKEKSIMEWSMAALNLSKGLVGYFWSPKK